MRSGHKRFGFTMVEALASVVLISMGIVAALQTFGALAKADVRMADTEAMQRLAIRKYDEIVSAGGVSVTSSSGDFQSLGESRFVWRANQSATGTGNLDRITVEVGYTGWTNPRREKLSGLFCRPKSGGTP